MTALTLVSRDVLCRGTAGLAGELGEACLMHALPAGWINANRANVAQTLDQAEHRSRLCRFRHLAQPDEPALTRFRAALRQGIQLPPLLGRQPVGQPTLDLPPGLMPQIDTQSLQGARKGHDDLALPARLHYQLGQMDKPIVLDRLR